MKTTIFLILSMLLGVSFISDAPHKKEATLITENQNLIENTLDPHIDFILGNWTGTGFITDWANQCSHCQCRFCIDG